MIPRHNRFVLAIVDKLQRDPSGAVAFRYWDRLSLPPITKELIWEKAERIAYPTPSGNRWLYR